MNEQLINALLPYIISALGTVIAAVGAWIGSKIGNYIDQKNNAELIRVIIEKTVKYVEQVGAELQSQEKFDLAKQKAIEWANSKGLNVSEVELEILIEAFVNDFYSHYENPNESVVTE